MPGSVVEPSEALFRLLESGEYDVSQVEELIEVDASVIWYREAETMMSPLHLAAKRGDLEVVRLLIRSGHPWNVVTSGHISAGQLAEGYPDVYEFLVEEGVRTEFLLSLLGQSVDEKQKVSNETYLSSKLEYSEGLLLDEEKNGSFLRVNCLI